MFQRLVRTVQKNKLHGAARRRTLREQYALLKTLGVFNGRIGPRPAPLGDQIVFGRVRRDAVKPSVKRTITAEFPQRPVSLNERLLCEVLHLTGI